MKLLLAAGFAPQLSPCAACGEREHLVGFSGAAGGVVCPRLRGIGLPARRGGARFLVEALGRPLADAPAAEPRRWARPSARSARRRAPRPRPAETAPPRPRLRRWMGPTPPTEVGTRYVYDFSEGSREMRDLLGGKGANVAEMTRVLGAERVPAGFTITTEACVAYMQADGEEPDGLDEQVAEALGALEDRAGKRLGDPEDPLLVSVRSGARESMPGMLDTVLNLGLNDASVEGLASATGNPRFAWDSYRRFVQMFGNVVRGVPGALSRTRSRAEAPSAAWSSTPSSTSTRCAS